MNKQEEEQMALKMRTLYPRVGSPTGNSVEDGLSDTSKASLKLEVHDLNVSYGQEQVLHHINVTFPETSVTAIIGPSGSGKSTFLRTLNRLHDLDAIVRVDGNILLDGEDILQFGCNDGSLSRLRQRVGMVFQQPNPFPCSLFENVAYGLRIQGITRRNALRERVERVLRQVSLWDEVKDQVQHSALQLAQGQQQRLCIARTLAAAPEVLLLDEPCRTLDPWSTHAIEQVILSLSQSHTIIVTTSNTSAAHRLASKNYSFIDGFLIQCSSTL